VERILFTTVLKECVHMLDRTRFTICNMNMTSHSMWIHSNGHMIHLLNRIRHFLRNMKYHIRPLCRICIDSQERDIHYERS